MSGNANNLVSQLKVLHIYKTYYPDTIGGVEQVIRGLITQGKTMGVQADLLVLSAKARRAEWRDMDGVRVLRLQTSFEIASTPFSLRLALQFSSIAADYDILHYHFPWPFGDLIHWWGGEGKPAVVTYHSDIVKQRWLKQIYRPIMNWHLGAADAIVATSPGYLASSTDLAPFQRKCRVVPLGLDEADYPLPDSQLVEACRRSYGERYFSFVGVFRYYKGLDFLIEAASHVSATIVLMGDGPLRSFYQNEVARRGLGNVVFTGRVDDREKTSILAGSFAFVFPSHLRSEAFGLGLVEAAMMGKPMISCEIGTGTSFVNIHNVTGLVVGPADSAGLAKAMNVLLGDPDKAAQMGRAARRRFQENFSASAMASAYARIYGDITGNLATQGARHRAGEI